MPVTNINQNPYHKKNHEVGAKPTGKVQNQGDTNLNPAASVEIGGKVELSEAGLKKASQTKLKGDAAETSGAEDKGKLEQAMKDLKGSAGNQDYLKAHKGISNKRVLDLLS